MFALHMIALTAALNLVLVGLKVWHREDPSLAFSAFLGWFIAAMLLNERV